MSEIINQVLKNNLKREYWCLSKYACKSTEGVRKKPEREKVHDRINVRPMFFHDTDKIMHSLSYTRYIDKTQVFYLFENDHITHRVLHVQMVSKIGRVIGRCLRLNEDLIEAISLGHDIGHVPYGHDGERYLNNIYQESNLGFFCHNAQSVRFLMELENKGNGLNLTLQVLDGILCHNGELLHKEYEPHLNKTWDDFIEEYNRCWNEEGFSKKIKPMTLEGCVMRISDVIAYIGRDIEDAILLRLIKRPELPKDVTKILGDNNGKIIDTLVMNLINNSYNKPFLKFSDSIYQALDILLKFNYQNIYKNPKKQTEDYKIEKMFRYLFSMYLEQLKNMDSKSEIVRWINEEMSKDYIEENRPERAVLDFISGMTDDFFNNQFRDACIPKSFGLFIKQ
jgi:dGTPase